MKKLLKYTVASAVFLSVFFSIFLMIIGGTLKWIMRREEMKNMYNNPNSIAVVDSVYGRLYLFDIDTITGEILFSTTYKWKNQPDSEESDDDY